MRILQIFFNQKSWQVYHCLFTLSVNWRVRCLGYKMIMNFQDIFLTANRIGSETLNVMLFFSQTSECKSATGSFWGSTRFIAFACNAESFVITCVVVDSFLLRLVGIPELAWQNFFYQCFIFHYPEGMWPGSGFFHWIPWQMFLLEFSLL